MEDKRDLTIFNDGWSKRLYKKHDSGGSLENINNNYEYIFDPSLKKGCRQKHRKAITTVSARQSTGGSLPSSFNHVFNTGKYNNLLLMNDVDALDLDSAERIKEAEFSIVKNEVNELHVQNRSSKFCTTFLFVMTF